MKCILEQTWLKFDQKFFWINDLDNKNTFRSPSCIPKLNKNYNELKLKKNKFKL